jgi:hypothetical protein
MWPRLQLLGCHRLPADLFLLLYNTKTFMLMKNIFSLNTVAAGLLVGTLDITAACIQFYLKTGKGPEPVLRYISSGAFGQDAFAGGNSMIFWGLFFHYLIAMSFTFFFFWLAKSFPVILKIKMLTAVLYGIFMWIVTQLIVVPLSIIPSRPITASGALIAISILIVCIAIPLAWIAGSRFNSNKK